MALQISRKYDFKPGTRIYSAQVDEELNQLVTAHNSVVEDKAEKNQVITRDNIGEFTPSGDYQPATKKYVDDVAGDVVLGQIPDGTITKKKLNTSLQSEILAVTDDNGKKYHLKVANKGNLYPKDQLVIARDSELYPGLSADKSGHSLYYPTNLEETGVSNGTQFIFQYGDPSSLVGGYALAHFDPINGATPFKSFTNLDAQSQKFICADKNDPDIAYIVGWNSTTSKLVFMKIRISTKEVITDSIVSEETDGITTAVDLGNEVLYKCKVNSGSGVVAMIDKTTLEIRQVAFSGLEKMGKMFGIANGKLLLSTWSGSGKPYSIRFLEIDLMAGTTKTVLDTTAENYNYIFAVYSKMYSHWVLGRYTPSTSFLWTIYVWDGTTLVLSLDSQHYDGVSSPIVNEKNGFIYLFGDSHRLKLSAETGELIFTSADSFSRYSRGPTSLVDINDNKHFLLIYSYSVFCYDTTTDTARMLTAPNDSGIPLRGDRLLFIPMKIADSEFAIGFWQQHYTQEYNWYRNLAYDLTCVYLWYNFEYDYISSIKEVTD